MTPTPTRQERDLVLAGSLALLLAGLVLAATLFVFAVTAAATPIGLNYVDPTCPAVSYEVSVAPPATPSAAVVTPVPNTCVGGKGQAVVDVTSGFDWLFKIRRFGGSNADWSNSLVGMVGTSTTTSTVTTTTVRTTTTILLPPTLTSIVQSAVNLAPLGKVIAAVTSPTGGGNHSLEVIRDGDKPPVGSTDSSRQFDSYDGANTATEDWIGYDFAPVQRTFTRVIFQEGKHFVDGGWFDSLTVQVRKAGAWMPVSGLVVTPAYPAKDNGVSYETYTLSFTPTTGDAIRLYGAPGGSDDMISVGELEVSGP